MQDTLNLHNLKTLLISAKNSLNSQLTLNRTKSIKYSESQYLDLVSFLSIFNSCAEEGSNTMNILDDVPSGDALLQQLKKLEFETVNNQFQELFLKQFHKLFPKAKTKNKKYKAIIIIDAHEQETYSKEKRTSKAIRGGKHKNGTNFFFKYLTMQVMIKDKIITLGIRFYSREDQQRELVDELIKYVQEHVKIEVILFDRGFRDASLFNNLEYRGAPLLMPCVKDAKAEKCFEELQNQQFKTQRFVITNTKKEGANVTLLMIRLSNDKEIGFYTTLLGTWLHSARYYLDLYKKRWNIETGYRLQNMFLPKTTSIEKIVRFFYFCYAVAMHNLWLIIRKTLKLGSRFTVLMMKIILVLFWVTTHLPKHW